ncbi:MAG: alpha/beta hydrolase [Prevotellaceae bacterium]|nr:alpha/beta hydrolase [Prevotellaceae bacterium]
MGTLFSICLLHGQQRFDLYEDGKIPDAVSLPNGEKQNPDDGILREKEISIPDLTAYFPEKPTGVAVIICPGGGYGMLATGHEGWDIAKRFNEYGISAFVLRYRLPNEKVSTKPHLSPIQDLYKAVDVVRSRADEWKIDTDKIGVIGFSAGGHLASTGGTHFDRNYIASKSGNLRPDFMILVYPVITSDKSLTHSGSMKNLLGENPSEELLKEFSNEKQITGKTPPSFLVHSADDKVVSGQNSIMFAEAIAYHSVPFEMHIFPRGGHGYGLNNGTIKADWFALCVEWIFSILAKE